MRIAIVGAGIGGLTSALALAAPGREITILERRTGFGEAGAGIQLSPNASRALIGLGLGAPLARLASEPERVAIRSLRSGRPIGSVTLGARMRERHGAPYWQIARSDLHTVLLDAVRSRDGIRLRVGRGAVSVAQDATAARLDVETATGGRETVEADLVVGADGLWSTVRESLGDRRQPRACGFAAYRALAPAAASSELPAGETGLWLGRREHLVHYAVEGGRAVNLVWVRPHAGGIKGWSANAQALPDIERLPPPLRDLVASARSWAAWSLHDFPVRSFGSGRVALLGDAAHPVLPYLAQGGALAIEDAASLAVGLGSDPADIPAALARWSRDRLPRVRRVQGAARRNGRAYHAAAPVSTVRDLVMGRLGPEGMADRYDWLYGWRAPDA